MSGLDKAVEELESKRAQDSAKRQAAQQAAAGFLKEFHDADLAPSRKLKERGVEVVFDGRRILLQRPEEGIYAEGMMIVVGEQGEIDVNGRSLGLATAGAKDAMRNELIAEIISHFDL
jgi:hypothetical protein